MWNVVRSCCGGPRGTAAVQPYTVTDPIDFFVFVYFPPNAAPVHFRIISRADPLASGAAGFLIDRVAVRVGSTQFNQPVNIVGDDIAVIRKLSINRSKVSCCVINRPSAARELLRGS